MSFAKSLPLGAGVPAREDVEAIDLAGLEFRGLPLAAAFTADL